MNKYVISNKQSLPNNYCYIENCLVLVYHRGASVQSWRNSSSLKINYNWKFSSHTQIKFTHEWQFVFSQHTSSEWCYLITSSVPTITGRRRGWKRIVYMTEIVGPLVFVYCVGYTPSDPDGFFNKPHIRDTRLCKDFCILPITHPTQWTETREPTLSVMWSSSERAYFR